MVLKVFFSAQHNDVRCQAFLAHNIFNFLSKIGPIIDAPALGNPGSATGSSEIYKVSRRLFNS